MTVEIRPAPSDISAARDRILAVIFEQARDAALPFTPKELALEAWDGDRWLGGLTARITQRWMFLHLLGVARHAQGTGVGSRLMQAAEDEARARDLIGLWLDTYSFQAPGFYAKLGYEEVGRIPDYPPGQARIFLAKRLDGRPVQAP
ncbi:acetyltransferase, GNAT family [Rubellimicrobium mesophilum DSM 19309]|uniref:Acetyltransferase, GNAT family n=1 Tax=Rubellimicrobium mesophilum DSM 19309 TaxID=442562 RepID=A0A017HI22_9RHOB|nr:GNAT family N-acetyltransferase [Rubellimicrobium mesophilum]EYD73970.1 acetyltransferase, GNAT family [Rubellimicrobium mesophilum DSM 19309]